MRNTFALLTLLVCSNSAFAATNATLSGRVTDPSGSNVPQARVKVTHLETNRQHTRQTSESGLFVFAELTPGRYRVEVSKDGFRTAVRESLELAVGGRVTENFELIVGSVAETVTVEGRAPLIDRDSGAVETLIDRETVQNMPLNGRSFQSLLELTPGITLTRTSLTNSGQFSVNGQRANANYFMIDGVSANIGTSPTATWFQQSGGTLPGFTIAGGTNGLVSIDALQEFRVQTSTYAPEYGRSPGGQISVLTRSGTNRYTGSLYNYFRNEKLDANDWVSNSQNVGRRPLRQNLFGGVFGGPVWIPKLYRGTDKTFFFVSYEGQRLTQPQPSPVNVIVPSTEARSQATGAFRAVLNAFPLPNRPALPGDPPLFGRYVEGVSFPTRFDATSVRLDHRFSDGLNTFFRANTAPSSARNFVFANGENFQQLNADTFTGGLTWTVRPSLVNDLRANYSRSAGEFDFRGREIGGAVLPPRELIFPPNTDLSLQNVNINLIAQGANVVSLNQGRSLGNTQRQWNIVNNMTWLRAAHQFKFGIDYRRLSPEAAARSTSIQYQLGGVEQFLRTGRVNVNLQRFSPRGEFVVEQTSFYAQDTWRLARRVTLTYGARWEINPPPSGDVPYTFQGLESPLTMTLAPKGTPQWETRYGKIAPRVGLAWQAWPDQDLVVRTGFGMFYDTGLGPALRGYTSFPSTAVANLLNEPWPVDFSRLVFPEQSLNPPFNSSFYVFPDDYDLPYTLQYNVAVEKGFGSAQTLSVSYVGALGRDLLRLERLRNQAAVPAQGIPAITMINPALFGPNGAVFVTRNGAASNYNSLQVQFQRRMTRGVQGLLSYTWSKSIDDASDEATANVPAGGFPGTNAGLGDNRGPSDFDINHQLVASASWALPGIDRIFTRGWSLDGFLRFRGAPPINVISTVVDPFNIENNRRVDLVPGRPVRISDPNAPGGEKLNRDAFAVPAAFRQGTLGRNALRGYSAQQVDLALNREFKAGERVTIRFRAEAFNLFNKPNFGEFRATYTPTDPLFGVATTTLNRSLSGGSSGLNPLYQIGGPRSIQLMLRVGF